MAKKQEYGNESIKSLKGADRVRKRPAVIFGSDGLEGCEHSVFEIMSNSIDEAREGYGNKICVTRFLDGSVEVQDFGRGIPVDYNKNEDKYNWELLFCEMYAGGKYDNGGDNYEFSLGLNGLGLCATQYASEYMEAEIHTDGYKYTLHFEKGENIGGLKKEKYDKKDTGTRIKWKPDLDVFTDINIPIEYFQETIKRQAIVNDGVKFILKNQTSASKFETFEYCYNDGIMDYVKEIAGDTAFTTPQYWECERKGKDREDLPEYKLKIKSAICFSLKNQLKEYYHNSSFLEHGGAPEKAFRSAFVNQINAYLKANNKYSKNDGQINIQDVEDCIIFVNMLTACARRTECIYLQILRINLKIDVLSLRQNRYRCGGGMYSALTFGFGYTLNTVNTRFKLKAGICAVALNGKADFLISAKPRFISI